MIADRYKTIRRGVTLVELLIVVSIITILAAIALPAMQTGMESRRIREAARAVHVFLGSAQVRALETGRSVGVLIERSEVEHEAGVLLRQVEVPPPYAGDLDGAAVRVWRTGPASPILQAQFQNSAVSNGLIKPGNRIQLNYQGPYYVIQSPAGPGEVQLVDGYFDFNSVPDSEPDGYLDWTLTLVVEGNPANLPWPTAAPSAGVPFQIIRNPMPSSVAPLGLPRAMVVDLGDSGIDGMMLGVGIDPMIMFSPDGQVERVYASNLNGPVSLPIFLMIGRRDRVGALLPEDGLQNYQDAGNLWLGLNPQTGRITVAEVHADVQDPSTGVYTPSDLYTSRELARLAQVSMGGR